MSTEDEGATTNRRTSNEDLELFVSDRLTSKSTGDENFGTDLALGSTEVTFSSELCAGGEVEHSTELSSVFSSDLYADGEQSSSFLRRSTRRGRQRTGQRSRRSASRQKRAGTRRPRGTSTERQRGADTGRWRRSNTGQQRGRSRSRGQFINRSEPNDKPELEVVNICTKTDVVKEVFPFMPERTAGFHLPTDIDTSNPEALFKLYFGNDIVEYICKASNEYAESLKEKKPTMYKYYASMTTDDFYKLVAIFIHFGYKKVPRCRLAWNASSLCYDPFIAQIMSRNKFESFMAFLHIVDKETEARLKDEKDKLLKVRPLYDHINDQCQKYCQPNMEISIDERMVRSKAHFSFKQYIRNKPTKWGFKLWCLCNAQNGYTVKFSVYRGKTGEVASKNGLSYDVVFYLMSNYLNQGYSLFVDNFYTSPTLAFDLFAKKTHVTGTLDRSRKGVPPEVIDCYKQLSAKTRRRGEGMYIRDGCVVYSVWKDTKCLSVLSTKYPGYSENTVKRNTKDANGQHQKSDVPIPSPIYLITNIWVGLINQINSSTIIRFFVYQKNIGKLCFFILLTLPSSIVILFMQKKKQSP